MGDHATRPHDVPAQLGGYLVGAEIGRGGMGVVYAARHVQLGRDVALKLIAPEAADRLVSRKRFAREARLAAAVEHPHVLPVYDAGEEDGLLFIAMRRIDGGTLKAHVQVRALTTSKAVEIVAQVASGLQAAHDIDIVHRDIKSSNVLLDRRQHSYLADFGLARLLPSAETITGAGRAVGTVEYMAPEVLRGQPADKRSDVYALGCLFFEVLTGGTPFARASTEAMIAAHLELPPPALPPYVSGLPDRLKNALYVALAKDPQERWGDAECFRAALLGVSVVGAATATPRRHDDARTSSGTTITRRATRAAQSTTPTFGREALASAVSGMMSDDRPRLLTLVGPGGVGKTRLAREIIRRSAPEFDDGEVWVDLQGLAAPDHVGAAIAGALATAPFPGEDTEACVLRTLSTMNVLLTLDNFEHVIEAADVVSTIAQQCPRVTVLVTSREALGLVAEHVVEVPPLATGARDQNPSPAARVFLSTAQRLGVPIDASQHSVVEEICTRVEGMPLAIELAAARTTLLSPSELAGRLDAALTVLGTGPRDIPARQRTIKDTIDWSVRLLSDDERTALLRFSAFSGGATLADAETVTGCDTATLERLVRKHLLRRQSGATTIRLNLLDSVRAYARDEASRAGVLEDAYVRHTDVFTRLAEDADPYLFTHDEEPWRVRLDAEIDNLRAILDRDLRHGSGTAALRLAGALGKYWEIASLAHEGVDWLKKALSASGPVEPIHYARGLSELAALLGPTGQHSEGKKVAQEAVQQARDAGDQGVLADALIALSELSRPGSGAFDDGTSERRSAIEAHTLAKQLDDPSRIALALVARAGWATAEDREREYAEAVAALNDVGDQRHLASIHITAAYTAIIDRRYPSAAEHLDQARAIVHATGDYWGRLLVAGNYGLIALFNGRVSEAQQHFDEQLRICLDRNLRSPAAEGLAGHAVVSAYLKDYERAAGLLAAAKAIGPFGHPDVEAKLMSLLEPARLALGPAWERMTTPREICSLDETLRFALERPSTAAGARRPDAQ